MTTAMLVLYLGSEIALAFVVPKRSGAAHAIGLLACVIAASLMLLGAYRLMVRAFERRRALEIAQRPGIYLFAAGFAWGAVLMAVVLLLLGSFGLARFVGFQGLVGLAPAAALALLSAVGEELVFRGSLYRIVEEGWGSGVALGVSGALFGLAHLVQPGADLISAVAIALEAGVLLALAYAWSRNLWLPIGIHLGWNFAEGGIFSQTVSGGRSQGLIKVVLHGPPRLIGGAFGPEASPVAIAVGLAAAAALLYLVLRSGRWRSFQPKPTSL